MRTAPPAAAAPAPLAAGAHRARRAPACACVPPRCAHTHAQVVIVTVVFNMHKAYNFAEAGNGACGLTLDCTSSAAGLLRASRTRCASIGSKVVALPPSSTPRSTYHGQELSIRIKFIIMDFAVHVSADMLEPNEHAHNIPRITRTRPHPHETNEPEDASARNALSYSMACSTACSMAQAGDGDGDRGNGGSNSSTAAAAATVEAAIAATAAGAAAATAATAAATTAAAATVVADAAACIHCPEHLSHQPSPWTLNARPSPCTL